MSERPRERSRRTKHGSAEAHDRESPHGRRATADGGRLWTVIHPHDRSPAAAYEDLVRTAEAALEAGQMFEAAIAFLRAAYLANEMGWRRRGRKLLGRVSELKESPQLGRGQRDRLAALMRCPAFGRRASAGSWDRPDPLGRRDDPH